MVLAVRQQMPRLGTRKLYHILHEPMRELGVGRDRLFAILSANHLAVKPHRNYRTTTNSHHRFRKHKNLVSGMEVTRPEQVWVSDITYLGSRGNHSYLALVTDAYSKKIMGYNLSNSLHTEGSLKALRMAIKDRKYKELPLIHHSDRGLQYCSDEYQEVLLTNSIRTSMTESYDPYENAVAERVNGIIKNEFSLEKHACNRRVLDELVRESVDIYNRQRPHYSCHLLTPEQMHQQRKVKIRNYKNKDSCKVNLAAI